jgi:hypothetical protein
LHNLFRNDDDDYDELLSFIVTKSHDENDVSIPSSSSVLDVPWGPIIGNNNNNVDEEPNNGSRQQGMITAYNDDDNRAKKKSKKRTTTPEKQIDEPTENNTADKEENPAAEEEGGMINKKQQRKQKRKKTSYTEQQYINMDPLSWSLPQPVYPIRNQTSEEFMLHYIAMKRRYNISLPWEKNVNNNDMSINDNNNNMKPQVSLPLPIISLNFPKSATLTMSAYFDCAGLTSIHTSTQNGRIALCMLTNQLHNHPPMYNCDSHIKRNTNNTGAVPIDFYSDIGLQGPPCYYASLHDGGLENIVRHYPNATILLVTRDAASWYHSMVKWGGIMGRWKKYCGFDGHLHTTTTTNSDNSTNDMEYWKNMYNEIGLSKEKEEIYWINFYNAHTQKIREFVLQHLSLTYIEVEIENPNIGSILQHYTKVSPECVLYCHPGPHWIKKHNTITKCHPIGQEPALLKEGEIWPGYKKMRTNSDDDNRGDDEGNNETLHMEGNDDEEKDDDD